MKTLLVTLCLAAFAAFVSSTPGATASCTPLPTDRQGVYRTIVAGGIDLRLTLGNCTYKFTDYFDRIGVVGDYTIVNGDATSGQLVVSNTPLCANPHEGAQDLPTMYSYSFTGYTLVIRIAQDQPDPCGFRQTRIGQYPWVRAIGGKLTIVYDGTKAGGTFKATGAVADGGTYSVKKGTIILKGSQGTISFRESAGKFTIVSGTGAYIGIHGKGTEVRGSGSRLHVVMTGSAAS